MSYLENQINNGLKMKAFRGVLSDELETDCRIEVHSKYIDYITKDVNSETRESIPIKNIAAVQLGELEDAGKYKYFVRFLVEGSYNEITLSEKSHAIELHNEILNLIL